MKRISIQIDKGENKVKEIRSLLFLEHNGLFILYIIHKEATPVYSIGFTSFEPIVTWAQNYLSQIDNYEVIAPDEFDEETLEIFAKLRI